MTDNYYVQSLLRGLGILRLVAEAPDGMTLQQIAEASALRPSTAHKLARTLVHLGYLEKTPRPVKYRLGAAPLDIANAHWNSTFLRNTPGVMESLHARTPDSRITVCEAIGVEVVSLLRISPERPGYVERPTHRNMRPYTSAAALTFQAYWPAERRAAFRRAYPFTEHGAHLWSSTEDMDCFLDAIRREGHAVLDKEQLEHYAVAAPVFSGRGVLRGTLGMSVRRENLTPGKPEQLIEEVTHAAQELNSLTSDAVTAPELATAATE